MTDTDTPAPTGNLFEDVTRAHKHSSNHRAALERSECCGCFYCLSIFGVEAIDEWIDEETTAICPRCGVDSVIGSASRFPIEKTFLEAMHGRWFG